MSAAQDVSELYARLDDHIRAADKGELAVTDFLTPRELHYAEAYLKRQGVRFITFGGYDDAERKKVYILPEYMDGVTDAAELSDYGHGTGIGAVSVTTAGYRRLCHRDYLGSVLGLGLERQTLGDIFVYGDGGERAVIFCNKRLEAFLEGELLWVAREKVRCKAVEPCEVEIPERRLAPINDTVASARVDCVVSALCSLSRDKARGAVEAGLVEVDFEPEERPDKAIVAPCTVSVRGHGRFRVRSVEDKTKKGRYRLVAEKYL